MSNKPISRRDFLKVTALAGIGAGLAACAPKQEATKEQPAAAVPTDKPAVQEGVLLRYWAGWGGEGYQKCWDEIQALDGFKQILGNNTFEVKLSVGEEPMLTAIAGGDPPDTGGNINYMGFMARGVLLPIDSYVAASTESKPENFLEGVWNLGFYKGVQYGIPTQEDFLRYGLNYNLKLVQEAGLDANNPPQTWDDLYAWHEKLTVKDSAGNIVRIGVNPYGAMGEGLWDTDGWMAPISWNWQWFDEKNGTFDLNNAKMASVFGTLKKFVDLVGPDNLAALYSAEGRDTWGGAYNVEAESMIIEGYWHPGETAFSAPEISAQNRATWLPVPADRKGTKAQLAGGHSWTIFKESKKPDIMFKIGEFLNTKDPCTIIWNNQGWLPAVKSFLDSVDPSKYPGLDFYFMSAKETTEWHTPARCEITSFVSNEYLSLKDQVNRNEMTPEQAAEEFQKRVETEYTNQGFKS